MDVARMTPFIIYALPRSRTFWLSRFLTYGPWNCGHETAITMRSMQDVRNFFAQPYYGTAETAAAPGWRILQHYFPQMRQVVIRRPVEDVVAAMLRVDVSGVAVYDESKLRANMNRSMRDLERISADPRTLSVDYDELNREDVCAYIFEYCLMLRFDKVWWNEMKEKNLQRDVKQHLLYYHNNRFCVEKFKVHCKKEMRNLVYSGSISSRIVT
jgi:hypothetical protein